MGTWCVALALLHGLHDILGGALDALPEEIHRLRHVDRGADLIGSAESAREGALGLLTWVSCITWRFRSEHLRLVPASRAASAQVLHASHDAAGARAARTAKPRQVELVEEGATDCSTHGGISILLRGHVVPPRLLILLLQPADLLLLSLQICLQSVILTLQLVDLVFEFGHFGVPGGLLSFMAEHQLGLLGLSSSCTLLNLSLAIVKVLTLLIQLALQVKHFALLLLLEQLQLLAQPLVQLALLLVPLIQVAGLSHLVARLQLQTLGHV